jgi:hypothetical protein
MNSMHHFHLTGLHTEDATGEKTTVLKIQTINKQQVFGFTTAFYLYLSNAP